MGLGLARPGDDDFSNGPDLQMTGDFLKGLANEWDFFSTGQARPKPENSARDL